MNDLKAVLQSCTRGADACTTAITNLNRLVADLDTAALFARAGTLQESFKTPTSPTDKGSVTFKQRAFQTAQEAVMQAEKGIVEDMQTLVSFLFIFCKIHYCLMVVYVTRSACFF